MRRLIRTVAACALALPILCGTIPVRGAEALSHEDGSALRDSLPADQKQAIEELIRQYILDHPEVIVESVQKYHEHQQAAEQEAGQAAVSKHREALEQDPAAPVAGNPRGDVTIVEFFDYHCGFCKRVLPTVQELLKTDPGVRYVFKEFPILGPESVIAARAALAVWRLQPDKYLAFHVALMQSRGSLAEEQVLAIAGKVGVDREKLQQAMARPEIEEILKRNFELAQDLRIRGTPAFVIGDKLVPGAVSLDQLREMIAAVRAG
jgi:protein-disulfide isomerase